MQDSTSSPSPDAALAELLEGNRRFVEGAPIHPHQDAAYRASIAVEQRPFAVIFGCSDSRLAAEIIFDRGLGDLFMVRTAGHIVGPGVLASIEYGVSVLGAPLVIVLGHDSCGAISAARAATNNETPMPENLRPIIDGVAPSIRLANARRVTDADGITNLHVSRTVDMIASHSDEMSETVAAGRCTVVGMSYRLADGRVTLLDAAPVPL
ncbi:carbonic anhydrase [Stackebrandtia soli]|uniref:carbonic anhydrase n=1 Tax=Stackebrandtia soli TaxID=1892856 RepID=UPI0039ED213C